MSRYLLLMLLVLLPSFAIDTFSVPFKGKTLTLSRDIDDAFMGPYLSMDKRFRSGFYLSKIFKKSYQIWLDSRKKRFFEWGVLVKDNKLFLSQNQAKDPKGVSSKHYVLVRYFYSKKFHIALLTHRKFSDGRADQYLFDESFIQDKSLKID